MNDDDVYNYPMHGVHKTEVAMVYPRSSSSTSGSSSGGFKGPGGLGPIKRGRHATPFEAAEAMDDDV